MMMWQYLAYFMGTPYVYGGNSVITGIDCSGLVLEGMRAKGYMTKADMGSQQLAIFLKANGWAEATGVAPDDILFFGKNSNSIEHVAVAVNETQMIEAGGGDSTTVTMKQASERNAMVRIRPINWRKDFLFALFKD